MASSRRRPVGGRRGATVGVVIVVVAVDLDHWSRREPSLHGVHCQAGIHPVLLQIREVRRLQLSLLIVLFVQIKLAPKLEETFPLFAQTLAIRERVDSLEFVVKDDMVLGADFPSAQVENQWNKRRMKGQETKEHAKPSSWSPLRNLLSILQLGLEHVGWTTENMSTTKVLVGKTRLRPNLIGADASRQRRKAIEDPDSVRNCKWPQTY